MLLPVKESTLSTPNRPFSDCQPAPSRPLTWTKTTLTSRLTVLTILTIRRLQMSRSRSRNPPLALRPGLELVIPSTKDESTTTTTTDANTAFNPKKSKEERSKVSALLPSVTTTSDSSTKFMICPSSLVSFCSI